MPPHATDCPDTAAQRQPRAPPWEVADLFRLYGAPYRRTPPGSPAQQPVRHASEACRTAQFGGPAEHCPRGGGERYAYPSWRNRPCPKCQPFTKGRGVEDRKAELLPGPYCPLVFTVPHDLPPRLLAHQRPLLTRLFTAASQTLGQFGPRHLGGQLGGTMVRQPWEQT